MFKLRLLSLIILMFLTALLVQKYNTPEVREKIGGFVSKIKETANMKSKPVITAREQQIEMMSDLKANLARAGSLLKEIDKNQKVQTSTAVENKGFLSSVVDRVFGNHADISPLKAAEAAIVASRKLIVDLEAANVKIMEEQSISLCASGGN